jgi:transposase InsO family protein
MGPIKPHSPLGNCHILVITDYFTKWIEVVPLANTTALAKAKVLMDRIILYHGPPRTLVTERGSNFTSQFFTSLCKTLQIIYLKTTAYHPQSNGRTERFNRTMAEMLRKYLEQGFSKWEDALGPIAFAYRNSVHSSTNETPNRTVLARPELCHYCTLTLQESVDGTYS